MVHQLLGRLLREPSFLGNTVPCPLLAVGVTALSLKAGEWNGQASLLCTPSRSRWAQAPQQVKRGPRGIQTSCWGGAGASGGAMWLEGLPEHKQEDTEGTLWGSGEAARAPWAAPGRGPEREREEPAGADAGGRPAGFALLRSSSQVSSWGQKSRISPWATAPPRLTQKRGPRHAWHPAPVCDQTWEGPRDRRALALPASPWDPSLQSTLCSVPHSLEMKVTASQKLSLYHSHVFKTNAH